MTKTGSCLPPPSWTTACPGRTTRLLGITLEDHGEHIPGARFNVSRRRRNLPIGVTPRIGITQAADWPLRYLVRDDPNVSRTPPHFFRRPWTAGEGGATGG